MTAALVGAIGQASATGASTTVTLTRTITAGNAVVVVGTADFGGLNTTMAFTDNAGGNSYDAALDLVGDPVNQQCIAGSHKENHPGGSTIFTITFDSSRPFRTIAVFEFSGVRTSGALGGHSSQFQALPGTGADGVSSGSITPSASPGILLSVSLNNGNTGTRPTAGTGFTSLGGIWDLGGGANTFATAETIATTASALAGTFTAAVNEQHLTIALLLLEPAAAASDLGESAGRRQVRQNAIYRMSPRADREAQLFLRAQKRAYGFGAAA